MNILIADDSKLNRLVLRELLNEFQKVSKRNVVVVEVDDGLKAVEACDKAYYDLILMDIMMPNMDGIAATQIIGKKFPQTMIVAVSALDDDVHKRDILKAGAEDYLQKPISGEIFLKRMAHYASIIESRATLAPKRAGIEVINPFDSHIYNRRVSFLIFDQDSLGEFWDYFMQSEHNAILADLIRLFYGIGVWQLKLGYRFYIFLEENQDFWYFTMTNAKLLNNALLMRIIEKNYPNGIFELIEDRVAFCVPKTTNAIVVEKKALAQTAKADVLSVQANTPAKVELNVYDFMDSEDLEEALEINDNLRSLMLLVGSSDLEFGEIEQIANYLQKFSRILNKYNEVYAIANVIRELGATIQNNAQTFKDRSSDIAKLCQAFNSDLATWLRALFAQGAPSIDFMDQSIISDANMLTTFLQPQSEGPLDLGDIFDF